jgi:hypothetical protein
MFPLRPACTPGARSGSAAGGRESQAVPDISPGRGRR